MTIWWWVAQHAAITGLMVAVVLLACRLIPNRPALQHALWGVVLLKFLLPPLVVWPISATDLWSLAATRFEAAPTGVEALAIDSLAPLPMGSPGFGNGESTAPPADVIAAAPANLPSVLPKALDAPTVAPHPAPAADRPATAATVGWYFNSVLLAAWMIGSLLTAARLLRRIAAHRRLAMAGSAPPTELTAEVERVARALAVRTVPVVVSDAIGSPFVWCLGKPRLIWPSLMCDQPDLSCWQGVIAHELAHIRRRDHWTSWLELIAGIVWWWNPLFWIARRRLRESAEIACDALAVHVMPAGRLAYAQAFLELSLPLENSELIPALGVGSRDRQTFERRLAMILSPRIVGNVSKPGLIATALLAVLAVPGWAWVQADPPPPGEAPANAEAADDATPAEQAQPSTQAETTFEPIPTIIATDPKAPDRTVSSPKAPAPVAPTPAARDKLIPIDDDGDDDSTVPSTKMTMVVDSTALYHKPEQRVTRFEADDPSIVAVELRNEDEVHFTAKKPGKTLIRIWDGKLRVATIDLLIVQRNAVDNPFAPATPLDDNRVVGSLADEVRNSVQIRAGLENQRADIERQLQELAAQRGEVLALTLGLKLEPLALNDVVDGRLAPFRGGLKIRGVVPQSFAEKAGLKTGDILVGVGKYEITNVSNLEFALDRVQSNAAKLTLRRDGQSVETTLETGGHIQYLHSPRTQPLATDASPGQLPLAATSNSGLTGLASAPAQLFSNSTRQPIPQSAPTAAVAKQPEAEPTFAAPSGGATSSAPRVAAPEPLDITQLGILLIDAQGEVDLSKVQLKGLLDAYKDSKSTETRNQAQEAEIKVQTAVRKLAWLTKIAQSAYDSAQSDVDDESVRCRQTEKLAEAKVITADELRTARRRLAAAESRLTMLESFPGIQATKRPAPNRTSFQQWNLGKDFNWFIGVQR